MTALPQHDPSFMQRSRTVCIHGEGARPPRPRARGRAVTARTHTGPGKAVGAPLALLVTLSACVAGEEPSAAEAFQPLTLAEHSDNCQQDPRVIANMVSLQECIGGEIFFRETFDGNGRTCSSCHAVENNFTIDPAFIATLPDSDPLFIAEIDPALANLEMPAELRAFSLILENVDGTDPAPDVNFTLRTVPHNLSMGVSVQRPAGGPNPPADRTGWSGDGAPNQGRLEDFTAGATAQHFTLSLERVPGVDFRVPTEAEGAAVATFMRELGRKNDIWLPGAFMSDAAAERGRQEFLDSANRCNGCHFNAGANVRSGDNRNFDTGVESARLDALSMFPVDGGFGRTPQSEGGPFGDGNFNTTPLVEAADTGPFFHTATTVSGASAHDATVAVTIEQAVAFYDTPAFNASPSGAFAPIDMNAQQIEDIARFLRVLNAAFNLQLAVKRLDGSLELVNHFQNDYLDVQRQLLRLAAEEAADALSVLGGQENLNLAQQDQIVTALGHIQSAVEATSHTARQVAISQARNTTWNASTGLGSGMNFIIGNATHMF